MVNIINLMSTNKTNILDLFILIFYNETILIIFYINMSYTPYYFIIPFQLRPETILFDNKTEDEIISEEIVESKNKKFIIHNNCKVEIIDLSNNTSTPDIMYLDNDGMIYYKNKEEFFRQEQERRRRDAIFRERNRKYIESTKEEGCK